MDFKTVSAKDFPTKVEKLELLENFEDSRELKRINSGVFRRKRWKRCVIK